jgi:predicted transcriptional regulator
MIAGEKVQHMFAEDLVKLVEANLKEPWRLGVGQVLWLGVDRADKPRYGKSAKHTKFNPVILTLVSEADLIARMNGYSDREVRERKIVRMFREAYEQGAVLSNNDVALLLGVSPATISLQVREYMARNRVVIPTRGTVHDIGRAITHKKVIIRYHLEGYLVPEIAKKTQHSEEACERYIKAFNKVCMLYRRGMDVDSIAKTLEMSPYSVREYLAILKEHEES